MDFLATGFSSPSNMITVMKDRVACAWIWKKHYPPTNDFACEPVVSGGIVRDKKMSLKPATSFRLVRLLQTRDTKRLFVALADIDHSANCHWTRNEQLTRFWILLGAIAQQTKWSFQCEYARKSFQMLARIIWSLGFCVRIFFSFLLRGEDRGQTLPHLLFFGL